MPGKKQSIRSSLLDIIDFSKRPVNLTLRGKWTLSTAFGGFLSLCLIAFIFYQVISQTLSMVRHENPKIYFTNELEDNPAPVTLGDQNNFFVGILITVAGIPVNLSTDSPFNFQTTLKQRMYLKNSTKVSDEHKLVWTPCLKSDFPDDIYGQDVYTTLGFNYAFRLSGINFTDPKTGKCPENITKDHPNCVTPVSFNISGSYFSEIFEYLHFKLTLCNSSDPTLPSNIKCTTANLTEQFESIEFKLSLFYSYTLVNPKNYMEPNQTVVDTIYWILNLQSHKTADIYVDRLTTQDFDNYWMNDAYHNKSFYAIISDKVREIEAIQLPNANAPLLEWNIRRSTLNKVVTRTYSKTVGFLIRLGGLVKSIVFILGLIGMGYVHHKYFVVVGNALFDFELSDPSEKRAIENERNDSPSPISVTPQSTSSPLVCLTTEGHDMKDLMTENRSLMQLNDIPVVKDLEEDDKEKDPRSVLSLNDLPIVKEMIAANKKAIWEYFENRKEQRKQLDTSTFGYFNHVLRYCSRRRAREFKLVNKVKKLVNEELDISKILRKENDINKLKSLLLTPDQEDAFNFIEKPVISRKLAAQKHSRGSILRISTETLTLMNIDAPKEPEEDPDDSLSKFGSLAGYERLYIAYRYLKDDKDPANRVYNRKLLAMVDQDLVDVFERVDQLLKYELDARKVEEVFKKIRQGPKRMFTKI